MLKIVLENIIGISIGAFALISSLIVVAFRFVFKKEIKDSHNTKNSNNTFKNSNNNQVGDKW